MMFAAAALALLVTLALAIARAILGPTVFDRVQAGNTVGTVAMMLLAVIGFLTGRPGVSRPCDRVRSAQRGGDDRRPEVLPRRAISATLARKRQRNGPGDRCPQLALPCSAVVSSRRSVGSGCFACRTSTRACMRRASPTRSAPGCCCLGSCCRPDLRLIAVKLAFLGLLIFFASPTATHALAKAALARGLEPLLAARRRAIEALIINVLLTLMAVLVLAMVSAAQSLCRRRARGHLQLPDGDRCLSRSTPSTSP